MIKIKKIVFMRNLIIKLKQIKSIKSRISNHKILINQTNNKWNRSLSRILSLNKINKILKVIIKKNIIRNIKNNARK